MTDETSAVIADGGGLGYGTLSDPGHTQAHRGRPAGEIPTSEDLSGGDDQLWLLDDRGKAGVQGIEATTTVWTRTSLLSAYAVIWLVFFVNTMQNGATSSLMPWVTSSFRKHSLTPTVHLMSQIVGGLFKLSLARILDVFGRPQGYLLSILLTTVGLAVMAVCRNIETYTAAQVLYTIGFGGLDYCLSIFLADTSSLQNRALVFAFSSSPYIITTWLSGPLSEAFLHGPGFRWAFATFAMLTTVVSLPLYALFMHNYRKAQRRGLVASGKSDRTMLQSLVHHGREFDVVGMLLICAGLTCVLLPLNLYSRQDLGWHSPLVLLSLALGILLVGFFVVWESSYAPVRFVPYRLLMDRTVFGACVLACVTFVSFYTWDAYFPSFLQVVNGLSVTQASYVSQIYSIGSCFWALLVGIAIRRTGRFKWLALYFGVPLLMVGVGLMICFRQPNVHVGYLVMCQIFIAIAGGTIVVCEQTAVMAATSHEHVAIVLAIEGVFASIGAAIGLTAAAAIWQSVFPRKLREYLPESELKHLDEIYGRLDVQLSYPLGSPARIAIQRAYGDGQKTMLLSGTTVLVVALVATAMWRDINVKNMKQVRGNVM
ncbi:hypothetical protein DCS_05471 [Drechmeria coniospora]|uniref:Major facilitator superfamily (MFS) profile domain-containing protein n=1 Tax=Drechmeria coniospora TaxID=98403 RepID=A0A151GMW5_DRECN|nr:hypothetical protein DCS_05471 [Drechmeria coniospora]KYK58455.1 hypothetical protein DCS_05471 [Drechmeria coniospora]